MSNEGRLLSVGSSIEPSAVFKLLNDPLSAAVTKLSGFMFLTSLTKSKPAPSVLPNSPKAVIFSVPNTPVNVSLIELPIAVNALFTSVEMFVII